MRSLGPPRNEVPNVKPPSPGDRRFGVYVYGARELRSILRTVYSVDLKDLSKIHREVGKEVVLPIARRTVPVRVPKPWDNRPPGRLKKTLRITATQRRGELRAGNSSIKYAGVVEYGGYNNIRPRMYAQKSLELAGPEMLLAYAKKLIKLLNDRGIKFSI